MVEFSEFYKAYPRKVARMDAEKAWKKMTPAEREAAVTALPLHLAYWKAIEQEKEYIVYPATWLNGKRWEDELEMPTKKQQTVIPGWWASEQATLEMAKQYGVNTYGLSWQELRSKIKERMAA